MTVGRAYEISEASMFTKPIILAIVTACSVPSTSATTEPPSTERPDTPPDGPEVKDQHWCCQSVDHKAKTGDGCSAISGSLEVINSCANVLYCPGYWTKEDGTVHCE